MLERRLCDERILYQQEKERMSKDGKLLSLSRLLEYAYNYYSDNIALIYKNEEVTYKQLYYWSCLMTELLIARGVKSSDKVLLLFENSPAFYVGYYGIIQAGAVVVPLNTFLHKKELMHIIHDAQPSLIIGSTQLLVDLVNLQIPIITQDDMPLKEQVPLLIQSGNIVDRLPTELSVLLYTSGTTGIPKGVMLSSINCMTNVLQAISRVTLSSRERVLGVLPLFHSFAQSICVWTTLFIGGAVIIVPKIDRKLILEGLAHQPTLLCGVPALYGLLCLLKNAPLDSVNYFISGGDALPDKIRLFFALLYGRKICNGYGLTEASPFVAVDLEDGQLFSRSVGRPFYGIEVAIRDGQGYVVRQGSIGNLWVKGDNVMMGYYQEQEMTAAVLQDGWLDTGDLAYIDDRNKIIITGRSKDLIIHKGFNIYPQEIENVLMNHPLVVRVAVVAQADSDTGQVPIAYVQIKKETLTLEKELKELCMQSMASYKIPRIFIASVKELPLTATGKVDKKELGKKN